MSGSWVRTRPWWARWPWNAVLGVVLLALLAAGAVQLLRPEDTSCAPGVRRVGEKTCVGVTDGSFHFDADLAGVTDLVHRENEAVAKKSAGKSGRDFVSVVYLMPLVPGPGDSNTPDSVRHEVQGAYTAQYEANHSNKYGDFPKIKLLLANTGSSDEERAAALEEIRERIEPERIAAVAGLGTSTDSTKAMVKKITADREDGGLELAAVGSVLSADTFATVKGLVRAAPTNSDEAGAAAEYLQHEPYADSRVLVMQDSRPDDQYTRTLSKEFLKALHRPTVGIEQYDSSQEGVATAFKTRMANLCQAQPDVVYFAGRGIDLPKFLAPLKDRPCSKHELIVFSGDDVSQSAQAEGFKEITETLRSGNVRLFYTGLAHPEAWDEDPGAYGGWAVRTFGERGRFHAAFPDEGLDDGQSIMGHDAVLIAVAGIRLAADDSTTNGRVTGSLTMQMWGSLHDAEAVRGASGLISLGIDGSPERKAVPIIEITPEGQIHTRDVSASTGVPLTKKASD